MSQERFNRIFDVSGARAEIRKFHENVESARRIIKNQEKEALSFTKILASTGKQLAEQILLNEKQGVGFKP
jgi:hypothetical protein